MTIIKDVVVSVRKQLNAWYENATTPGRILRSDWVVQAMGEAHKIGCELPDGSLALVYATWAKGHAVYLKSKERYERCRRVSLEWAAAHPHAKSPEGVPTTVRSIPGDLLDRVLASLPDQQESEDRVIHCHCAKSGAVKCFNGREPTLVLSPEDRMSASIGKALEIVEMMLIFLEVYVKDNPVKLRTEHFVRLSFALSALYMTGLAEKFMKLKLSTFDAIAKNQHKRTGGRDENLPPVKAPFQERAIRSRHFLPGLCGLQLSHFIMENRARAQFFVFWMKRAVPRVEKEMIAAQERATFEVLQVKHDPPPITIDGRVITHDEHLTQCVMTFVQALNLPKYSSEGLFSLPSCHAHYNTSRAEGGARFAIPESQPDKSDFIVAVNESLLTEPEEFYVISVESKYDPPLSMMVDSQEPAACTCGSCGNLFVDMSSRATESRLVQLETLLPSSKETLKLCQQENHPLRGAIMSRLGYNSNESIGEVPPLLPWFDQVYQTWAARDVTRHCPTEPVLRAGIIGLAEACGKVRPISKGPENAYYKIMHVQKFLHSALRRIPAFRLIGQPLLLDDISHTFKDPLKPGEFYVSGDYRSATDLLSSRLSEVCARIIAEVTEMPRDIEELFVSCLVSHVMTLGKEHAAQANGQLMGSPASFPVLCIVNAALSHYARELACGHTVEVGSYPLLINGDDIGFVADQRFYDIWKKITALGGLQFSVGKNFTSEEFLVLNSCMFEVTGVTESLQALPLPIRRSNDNRCHVRHEKRADLVKLMTEEVYASMTPYDFRDCDYERYVLYHMSLFCPEEEIPDVHDVQFLPTQGWTVTPWQNPDFLGPVGRYLGIEPNNGSLFSMPAFRRKILGCTSQLFDVSEYALIPGLQQAWLQGVSDPGERHRLNLVFISSWKPVLSLSQGPGFSKDWWLPTHLGGLGLENTDPNRTIESSSRASRCLATYLNLHPEVSPVMMPTISFDDDLQNVVSEKLASMPSQTVPRDSQTPNGWMDHADVLSHLMRSAWMDTFGRADESTHAFPAGAKQGAFESKMKELNKRLFRLWHHGHGRGWKRFHPISEEELAASTPHRKIYNVQMTQHIKTEHGEQLFTIPKILPHPKDESGLSVRFQDPRPFISSDVVCWNDYQRTVELSELTSTSASCADEAILSI